MAELTADQLAFLAAHAIPLSLVFDASGMSRANYQSAMEEGGRSFAFGVSRCKRGHQSIRARSGHCVQCNHAWIAFALRDDAPGDVYIAGSLRAELLKVGSTTDVGDRCRNIRNERWAESGDWEILAFGQCARAGRVERATQTHLSSWGASCEYVQGGKRHRSYEVFRCKFADARDALSKALPIDAKLIIPNERHALAAFNFC